MPEAKPLAPKYYSPADLVREASIAFGPAKLALTFAVILPFFFVGDFLWAAAREAITDSRNALSILETLLTAIPGLGMILALLLGTFMTRRSLENEKTTARDAGAYMLRSGPGVVALAVVAVVLWFVLTGVLWILGWARNMSEFMAMVVRFLKILPILTSTIMVVLALAATLFLVYVMAATAVEACSIGAALKKLRSVIRGQARRATFHAFLIGLVVFVAWFVLGLLVAHVAGLPDDVKPPDSGPIEREWTGYWTVGAFYDHALMDSLRWFIPLSLLSTLIVLSYLSLRQVEAAAARAAKPEETAVAEDPAARERAEKAGAATEVARPQEPAEKPPEPPKAEEPEKSKEKPRTEKSKREKKEK